MFQQAQPPVVRIDTNADAGSGVITNHHVIEGAAPVAVVVNDSVRYPGAALGVDRVRDLAVVRICCGRFQNRKGLLRNIQLTGGAKRLTSRFYGGTIAAKKFRAVPGGDHAC